ncbi:MAG: helix-turn-helix domain-containing protein, partial [Cyclobacteriaceae bacterium]
MKKYNQLTSLQRYEIEDLLSLSTKKTDIADRLDVHVSTIYREIKRNAD